MEIHSDIVDSGVYQKLSMVVDGYQLPIFRVITRVNLLGASDHCTMALP